MKFKLFSKGAKPFAGLRKKAMVAAVALMSFAAMKANGQQKGDYLGREVTEKKTEKFKGTKDGQTGTFTVKKEAGNDKYAQNKTKTEGGKVIDANEQFKRRKAAYIKKHGQAAWDIQYAKEQDAWKKRVAANKAAGKGPMVKPIVQEGTTVSYVDTTKKPYLIADTSFVADPLLSKTPEPLPEPDCPTDTFVVETFVRDVTTSPGTTTVRDVDSANNTVTNIDIHTVHDDLSSQVEPGTNVGIQKTTGPTGLTQYKMFVNQKTVDFVKRLHTNDKSRQKGADTLEVKPRADVTGKIVVENDPGKNFVGQGPNKGKASFTEMTTAPDGTVVIDDYVNIDECETEKGPWKFYAGVNHEKMTGLSNTLFPDQKGRTGIIVGATSPAFSQHGVFSWVQADAHAVIFPGKGADSVLDATTVDLEPYYYQLNGKNLHGPSGYFQVALEAGKEFRAGNFSAYPYANVYSRVNLGDNTMSTPDTAIKNTRMPVAYNRFDMGYEAGLKLNVYIANKDKITTNKVVPYVSVFANYGNSFTKPTYSAMPFTAVDDTRYNGIGNQPRWNFGATVGIRLNRGTPKAGR